MDGEFRNTLYKNLVDAGYEKKEAQKIIGVKYHEELKSTLKAKFNILAARVEGESYDDLVINADELNGMITELKKVKGVIE